MTYEMARETTAAGTAPMSADSLSHMEHVERMEHAEHAEIERLSGIRQRQLSRVLYWRSFTNIALMLCDLAMFILGGAIALELLGEDGPFHAVRIDVFLPLTAYLLVAGLIWVLCLRAAGIYHRHVMGDGYQVNMRLFDGLCRCWVFLCALNAILMLNLSLQGLTVAVASAGAATAIERVVTRLLLTHSRDKGAYSYGTAVVGSPEGIGRTLRYMAQRRQLNYLPVAVCPIRRNPGTGAIEPDPDLAELERQVSANWDRPLPVIGYDAPDLAECFVNASAQTVMVSDVMRRFSDDFNTFAMRMETLGLEIALITSAADAGGHRTRVRSLQGVNVLTLCLPQYSVSVGVAKRIFDVVVSSLALLCSLIVTVPVALAIKLEDGGPVFYGQTRIGLRGKPFRMIKFRSMVTDADALKQRLAEQTGQEGRFIFKMKDDPRITRVGRVIRRLSIDELPQFLNVLKGDMSVVGPRPPLPEEYARYNPVYATRMLVKPGITGPWQVSGRSDLTAEESEQLDVAYVQSWSLLGDVVLMMRTVRAVLGHKGAY